MVHPVFFQHPLNAGNKTKYAETVKELIRSIANYRFSQLIEDKRASNVYFTAFVLDPDNRGATILATPKPLEIQPVTVSFAAGAPAVQPCLPLIQRIGLSLQSILQKEYGNEYRTDRTIEEAKHAMLEVNPYIAHRLPADALQALRTQLQKFLDNTEPFHHKKKTNESAREWWFKLLNQDDSDILAALTVKIFSANPVSMPDERGMSTVTWINSDVRNKQDVSTVSNHLAIRGFSRMGAEKVKSRESRPVTVNWRDMRETIHGSPNSGHKPGATASETSSLKHHDPVEDGLSWLNEGLPELRTSALARAQFELASEFDIDLYFHILADRIEGAHQASTAVNSDSSPGDAAMVETSLKASADSVALNADEWGSLE
ncbi:hypothetical protein C8J57DRAFT_1581220 [Mycena rebaudengoi]|nr:hypothetical protein C8J57DRAFT_1581220 [Mycena rebaudengoi]